MLTQEETVSFAHACMQIIAEDEDVDLLHVKGPALDMSLRVVTSTTGQAVLRQSIDADVLVRPSHLDRFVQRLTGHGWIRRFDFSDGSAFAHAATWSHPVLGYVDVHKFFPGIELDAEGAFDVLWSGRERQDIAGVACQVPGMTAQRLLMIIHAARGGGPRRAADIQSAWGVASEAERGDIDALAAILSARVALYAGTGRLDLIEGERSVALWRELSKPTSSLLPMWWARVRAEPDFQSRVRKAFHLALPNTRRMETWLGRPPTWWEVASAYLARARLGVRAVRDAVTVGRRPR